jgi:hypothetical protein
MSSQPGNTAYQHAEGTRSALSRTVSAYEMALLERKAKRWKVPASSKQVQ